MRYVDMQRSKLAIVALCMGGAVATSPSAHALTLGNAASQSSLGQPLRLVIPVALNHGENISAACLRLVSDSNAADTMQLVTGKVSFEPGTPSGRLIVTTTRPVNEPAIRVSLQSGCGDTTRRDYVLLLDPPMAEQATAPALIAADTSATNPFPAASLPALTRSERPSVANPRTARTVATSAPAVIARSASPAVPAAAQRAPLNELANTPVTNASLPGPLREVKLVTTTSSGGFISTASAQSLPLLNAPRQAAPSSAPMLERLWPYCAMLLCLGGLAMCVTVLRRQRSQRAPTWSATSTHTFSKASRQDNASQNTFAHYTEMTEPAPAAARKPVVNAASKREPTITTGELDTLLNEDLIDEEAIRKEWAAAASEHAVDIGTDSILKAIAVAEREMRIGTPPPAQVAIENALDEELLPTQKKR